MDQRINQVSITPTVGRQTQGKEFGELLKDSLRAGANALGTVSGKMALDRAEKPPPPGATALVAWTWNLIEVPPTRPPTFRLLAAAPASRRAPIWTLARFATRTE